MLNIKLKNHEILVVEFRFYVIHVRIKVGDVGIQFKL